MEYRPCAEVLESTCVSSILVPRSRAPFGQHQESLVLTNRRTASGDENAFQADQVLKHVPRDIQQSAIAECST